MSGFMSPVSLSTLNEQSRFLLRMLTARIPKGISSGAAGPAIAEDLIKEAARERTFATAMRTDPPFDASVMFADAICVGNKLAVWAWRNVCFNEDISID